MPVTWPGLIVSGAILAVAATSPLVWRYFPDYLPGHLIQAVAVAVGYGYFRRAQLLEKYPLWQHRALLLLSFVIPLQNTFLLRALRKAAFDSHVALEIFRPEILLLLAVVASAIAQRRRPAVSPLLPASFAMGLLGWLIATAYSAFPDVSAGNGLFEFLIPFLVLYAFLAYRADRQFALHSVILFALGCSLTALSQSIAILGPLWWDGRLFLPLASMQFLGTKMNLLLMERAGKNGYGNPDNFISLWVLLVPLLATLLYRPGLKAVMAVAFVLVCYAGLLVYSRSGLLIASLGLLAIVGYCFARCRRLSVLPTLALAAMVSIHIPSGGLAYLAEGLRGFFSQLVSPAAGADDENDPLRIGKWEPGYERSGERRLEAWLTGARIARTHPFTGIGFGVYPRADPVLTAPHSLLLLRFAEGGVLGGMSLLLLAAYASQCLWQAWKRSENDGVVVGCAVAANCLLLKAMIFGGSFSLPGTGVIVWGFGFFLALVPITDRMQGDTA